MRKKSTRAVCAGIRIAALARRNGQVLLVRDQAEKFFHLPVEHILSAGLAMQEAIERLAHLLALVRSTRTGEPQEIGSLSDRCEQGTVQHAWQLLPCRGEPEDLRPSRQERLREQRPLREFAARTSHVWATTAGLRVMADRMLEYQAATDEGTLRSDLKDPRFPKLDPLTAEILEMQELLKV